MAKLCETNEPKTWHSQIWILTKTIKVHIVCMHLTLLKDFFHRFFAQFLKIFRFYQFWGMHTILPITPTFWDLAVSNFVWQSFKKCFQRFSKKNWRFFFHSLSMDDLRVFTKTTLTASPHLRFFYSSGYKTSIHELMRSQNLRTIMAFWTKK